MTVDQAVFAFAGVMVLLSLALAYLVSPWWLLLTAFVGANMLQSAFTGFCPAAMVFKRMGCPAGKACTFAPGKTMRSCQTAGTAKAGDGCIGQGKCEPGTICLGGGVQGVCIAF